MRWVRLRWGLVLAVGVNMLTHPLLFWLTTGQSRSWLLMFEVVVVIVEAAVIWLVTRRDGAWVLLTSFAANALSLGLGVIILTRWVRIRGGHGRLSRLGLGGVRRWGRCRCGAILSAGNDESPDQHHDRNDRNHHQDLHDHPATPREIIRRNG